MFFEAILFVTEQREEEALSGGLSEEVKGQSSEAWKHSRLVYTRILWPMDRVLVDCHDCYGRKILEWSMCIKIQYLDSIGIPQKKKELEMGSVSPQSSLTDCCSNWCGEYTRDAG